MNSTARQPDGMRVVRLDLWIDPAFDASFEREPGLSVEVLPARGEATTAAGLAGAHAYHVSAAKDEVPARWQVSESLLAQCPSLLCVSSGGAGYDTVDVAACTRAGVAVVNQAGANAASVAEMTFALLLSLVKRLRESQAALQAGTAASREALMGHEIDGRTLGIVGIGEIGSRVARVAAGFGMRVLACDPLLPPEEIRARGAEPVSLPQLLEQADVVSLHCPLNDETRGMIGAEAYAMMRPGALFISTARGGIHDEQALLAALQDGRLAGAGLDVWSQEPPRPGHGLLLRSDVVATYHTGGVTHEGRRKVAQGSASQIMDMLAGRRPARLLNPEVWPRFLERLAQRQR